MSINTLITILLVAAAGRDVPSFFEFAVVILLGWVAWEVHTIKYLILDLLDSLLPDEEVDTHSREP